MPTVRGTVGRDDSHSWCFRAEMRFALTCEALRANARVRNDKGSDGCLSLCRDPLLGLSGDAPATHCALPDLDAVKNVQAAFGNPFEIRSLNIASASAAVTVPRCSCHQRMVVLIVETTCRTARSR